MLGFIRSGHTFHFIETTYVGNSNTSSFYITFHSIFHQMYKPPPSLLGLRSLDMWGISPLTRYHIGAITYVCWLLFYSLLYTFWILFLISYNSCKSSIYRIVSPDTLLVKVLTVRTKALLSAWDSGPFSYACFLCVIICITPFIRSSKNIDESKSSENSMPLTKFMGSSSSIRRAKLVISWHLRTCFLEKIHETDFNLLDSDYRAPYLKCVIPFDLRISSPGTTLLLTSTVSSSQWKGTVPDDTCLEDQCSHKTKIKCRNFYVPSSNLKLCWNKNQRLTQPENIYTQFILTK